MSMLTVAHALDLSSHIGREMGHSDWLTITQDAVDAFAAVSGDDHWIHVDVERAGREMPGGRTIVHGVYVLSLIPALQRDIYRIERRGRGLNYGFDRVRFVSPVPVGSRVRLKQTLADVTKHPAGTKLAIDIAFEVEGGDKPALVARNIILIEDP